MILKHPFTFRLWGQPGRSGIDQSGNYDEGVSDASGSSGSTGSIVGSHNVESQRARSLVNGLGTHCLPEAVNRNNTRDRKPPPEGHCLRDKSANIGVISV